MFLHFGVLARALLWSALLSGCGSSGSPVTPTGQGDGELLASTPGDRVEVARVNGVPIYDDCVAAQAAALAAAGHADAAADAPASAGTPGAANQELRRRALDQCIGFELLAQEAQRHRLAKDADVLWSRKTEAVRRLIDEEFVARYPDPDHIDRAMLEQAFKSSYRHFYRPEYRHVRFVLVEVDKAGKPGSPEDLAAQQLADEIYRALAGQKDIAVDRFDATTAEVAGDRTHVIQDYNFPRHNRAVEEFAAAAFAIAEVGTVAPPVRTRFGWHVILLKQIDPEKNVPLEQAKYELFPFLRTQLFMTWSKTLGQGADVEVNEQALIDLQAAEDERRFASSPGSP